MNTFDDVNQLAVDRYNGIARDAEQLRMAEAIRGAPPRELHPTPVRPSLQTRMLRLLRGLIGKVAPGVAQP